MSEQRLRAVFQAIAEETRGFIAGSLVDVDSGMMLAEYTSRSDFDLTRASALVCSQVHQQYETIRELDLGESFEDVMVVLEDQVHLIRSIDGSTFAFIAAERGRTNLGLLRSQVSRRSGELVLD